MGEAAQGRHSCASLRRKGVLLQGWNGVGVQCQALILFLSNRLRARERKRDSEGCSGPRTPAGLLPPQLPQGRTAFLLAPRCRGPRPLPSPATCRQTTLSGSSQHPSLNNHLRLLVASGTRLGLLGMAWPSGFHLSRFLCSLSPRSSPPCPLTRVWWLPTAPSTFSLFCSAFPSMPTYLNFCVKFQN